MSCGVRARPSAAVPRPRRARAASSFRVPSQVSACPHFLHFPKTVKSRFFSKTFDFLQKEIDLFLQLRRKNRSPIEQVIFQGGLQTQRQRNAIYKIEGLSMLLGHSL